MSDIRASQDKKGFVHGMLPAMADQDFDRAARFLDRIYPGPLDFCIGRHLIFLGVFVIALRPGAGSMPNPLNKVILCRMNPPKKLFPHSLSRG